MRRFTIYALEVYTDLELPIRLNNGSSKSFEKITLVSGGKPEAIPYVALEETLYSPVGFGMKVTKGGGKFRQSWPNGLSYLIDLEGAKITYYLPTKLGIEYVWAAFAGPVVSFWLSMRGFFCIHASAVEVLGRVIAFVGPPGAGKSTIAISFEKKGYPIICDDVLPIDVGVAVARPLVGSGEVRLWPDVLEYFCEPGRESWPVVPEVTKRGVAARVSTGTELELVAVYCLKPTQLKEGEDGFLIHRKSGVEALLLLMAHGYVIRGLPKEVRSSQFAEVKRLLEMIYVAEICYTPSGVSQSIALVETVLDHLNNTIFNSSGKKTERLV